MAIKRNVLAESGATVQAEDGTTMYATIQMRHGKESDMDKSKFVPAEIGVTTDTKKAFMAFGSNQVKEMMFREDSEIEELLGEVREISDKAVEAVESAEATAKKSIQDFTDQMKATIPEDYTETVKKVDILERTKASAIYKTASGESLQIEDSADAPLAGLKVYGKSRQVKTTGAQLAELPSKGATINGVTFTINSDGTIIANGTATGLAVFRVPVPSHPSTGEFCLSGCPTGGSFESYRLDLRNGSSSVLTIDNGSGAHIKISDTVAYIGVRIAAGYTANNVVFHPMLNSGSTALPLEPYTGGKPSPSPDYPQEIEIPGSEGEIEVSMTGNQLLDVKLFEDSSYNNVKFTKQNNGGIYVKGEATDETSINANLKNSGYKAGVYSISGSNGYALCRIIYDSGNGYQYVNSGKNIELNDFDTYNNILFQVYVRKGTSVDKIIYPMLNRGSTALPWEPYQTPQKLALSTPNGLPGIPVDSGGNYTDSDGQQWICDEVDFDRGKYVQRVKKLELLSSSNWMISISGYRIYFTLRDGVIMLRSPVISNYFVVGDWNDDKAGTIALGNSTQAVIGVSTQDFEDIDAFKAWLDEKSSEGDPCYVIYPLATPIETDLSEEELTAYAALRTNYPTTVVTSDSDPEVGIEVEYVADTKTFVENKINELKQLLAGTQSLLVDLT